MRVETLGNNQVAVNCGNKTYFISYESNIAYYENGKVVFSNLWDYSRTTMKYLKIWLWKYTHLQPETKKEIEKLIKNGDIIVIEKID